jgi:hypothetical protein
MTFSDLIHGLLAFMGFIVGIGVGLPHGLRGAALGALVGFLVGHVMGILLAFAGIATHAIGVWWSGSRTRKS